jgi:hypothetical protein
MALNGLSDEASTTIICFIIGGILSLIGVYVSLKLSINTLEVQQEANEKEISRLRGEIKEVKGELKDSINEMKDLLQDIKLDIERIRP